MEIEPFGYLSVKDINIEDFCIKIVNNFKETGKTDNMEFKHEILGPVSVLIENKDLLINFENIGKTVRIFQNPIILKNEKNIGIGKIFNKDSLETFFSIYSNDYDIYDDNSIINLEEALINIPKELKLKERRPNEYDLFSSLNYKKEMPKAGINDIIETNNLTPVNLYSLNIKREENLEIIIENRDYFIDEILKFISTQNITLKIFGCDGIGKSLTFLYLTSLRFDFKIIYFNLKEINQSNNKLKLIEYQLMIYFSTDLTDLKEKEQKEKLCKYFYQNYLKKIQLLENEFDKDSDFWNILDYLIRKNDNNLKKLVYIIDQYKSENDTFNKVNTIQKMIIEKKKNIKLIISSSLNDMNVKSDFIGVLKNFEKKKENINKNKVMKNVDDLIDKQCDEIFKDYSPNQDYMNDMAAYDKLSFKDYFPRIKIFNKKISQETNIKNIPEISSNDNKTKTIPINERVKIIYLNNLISVKNIANETKEFLNLLTNFDYNPKYYYKLKKFSENYKKLSLKEKYPIFLQNINTNISRKIKEFYKNYNLKTFLNLDFDQIMVANLVLLFSLVEDEVIINFNDLIPLIESFPLKYIKIIPINVKNDNIINIDSNISNYNFKLKYSFPFIKFIISRLIFDKGNHGCLRHINQNNGLGIFLEIQIKKSIILDKILGEFEYRSFWSFDDLGKSDQENFKEEIDIFNLRELNLDDINKSNIDLTEKNYYICPEKSNNKYIDSILLIPDNKRKNTFILIAFQITIKKNKIYSLLEYHQATLFASSKIKGVYKIDISKNYFVFVLAKDYINDSTQNILFIEKIPFIFYSTIEKKFYKNKIKEILDISYLFDDYYKVKDYQSIIEEESFEQKRANLLLLNSILNRKRRRDNRGISKNIFSFGRKKIYNEDFCLILPQKIKDDIITNILKKEKDTITIEYISKINFSRISEIPKEDNFLGVFFYRKNYFVYYKSLLLHSNTYLSEEQKYQILNIKQELIEKIFLNINNENTILSKSEKIYTYEYFMENIHYKVSDVYIYYIYELEEKKQE